MNPNPRVSFLSAALPYVNAPPHLGHALELVQVDALARFHRASGRSVELVSGSDDNSLKNVRAAEQQGRSTAELVRDNAARFRALAAKLGVEFDGFVQTGSDPAHPLAVQELWRRCAATGDVYEQAYRGLYCVGCEQFYTNEELVSGLCPEHAAPPELVEERNWFFRLSRYERRLEELIARDELRIEPEARRAEVLAFIRAGLRDFSISRSRERARGWGISVPGDASQVVFVWFDALTGYLSALGFGQPGSRFDRSWTQAERRTHLVGKGIVRFHAVYWPAILLSAGLLPPSEVLVHGYLTVEGSKIGKSLGNAIDPVSLSDEVSVDALRWYLLRHAHTHKDSDFSRSRLIEARNSELADQLGNLVRRVLTLIVRHAGGRVPTPGGAGAAEHQLIDAAERASAAFERGFTSFALHDAALAALGFVAETNRYLEQAAPWRLARDPHARERLHTVLAHVANALAVSSRLFSPLLPKTAQSIREQLGTSAARVGGSGWETVAEGTLVSLDAPLFPKYDVPP